MFNIINMINVEFIKNEIAYVSFDTGKRSNLLSLDIIRQLTDIADELNHNKKLMAIILSGGHQNFSFGFDLKDKEFLRLWFAKNCDPYNDEVLPDAPDDLVAELSARYILLYELITGEKFVFPNLNNINKRITENIKELL